MEKQDQHQCQVLLRLMLIQEKAKSPYEDLKKKQNWTVARIKTGADLHNVKASDEAATTGMVAAWKFPETLWEVMAEGAHLPKQIFHVDEAGLYWKRVADLSYISKEGKLLPGNKVGKDRLTLVTVLPGI